MAIPEKEIIMTTITAKQLIAGSKRLDEMWRDVELILSMLFYPLRNMKETHDPFTIPCVNGVKWVIQQMRTDHSTMPEIFYLDETFACVASNGDYSLVWQKKLNKPMSKWVLEIHASLDELVARMLDRFPELEVELAPVIAVGA
jgi:hypothetical protein